MLFRSGRNWSLAGGLDKEKRHTGWLDLRNNVVFNWKNRSTDGGAARVQFVNNYYKPGPATVWFYAIRPELEWIDRYGPQEYFITGNVVAGRSFDDQLPAGFKPWPGVPVPDYVKAEPFFESHVKTESAEQAFESVLADVGCNFPRLDEHDRRVLKEVRSGQITYRGSKTGLPGLPDSQTDVGGREEYPAVRRPLDWDTDADGMPDLWERKHGLNPADPSDGNLDKNSDGVTNLEDYLNEIATPAITQ